MPVTPQRILKNFTPQKISRFSKGLVKSVCGPKEEPVKTYRDLDLPTEDRSGPSPYPFFVNSDNELERLGEKYNPSKRMHNYLPYYWMHFRDIRMDVKKVVEIGLQKEYSIKMWEEFFPNAEIYGIDIDPACKKFEGDRRKVFIGDQGDKDFLNRFVDSVGGDLDIVIDDGSHIVDHQLDSFEVLFPALAQHGIYAMEDTGGVVGDYDRFTVNTLQKLAENVLYWPEGHRPEDWPYLTDFPQSATWADRNVVGVAVYRWLAFVFRGLNPGDNKHLLKR